MTKVVDKALYGLLWSNRIVKTVQSSHIIRWASKSAQSLTESGDQRLRAKRHFGELVKGKVVRYEMPGIEALNFVMERALSGGVSRSLNLDAHGKSWANLMLALELDVDVPKRLSQRARRRLTRSRNVSVQRQLTAGR